MIPRRGRRNMPTPANNADRPLSMSFAEAARLIGQPKAYLKELAGSGRLAVLLEGPEAKRRLRITRAGLIEAGLLAEPVEYDERAEILALIELFRDQSGRVRELEEQRFQLGVQLAAAMERLDALEARALEETETTRRVSLSDSAPSRLAVTARAAESFARIGAAETRRRLARSLEAVGRSSRRQESPGD